MAADGEVLMPLDRPRSRRWPTPHRGGGYEAVAVGLMHAYANDAHERLMAEALAEALAPDLPVSLSSVCRRRCGNCRASTP
jgi:N-methylhydantoinase A